MEEVFKASRLKSTTPASTQDSLLRALQAVVGVHSVQLRPTTHEFAIESEGVNRMDVLLAAFREGFRVQNNTPV